MSEDHPTLALDLPPVESLAGPRGCYTSRQFQERHPDKFRGIVLALGAGYKLEAIRKAYGVAWETVRAIQSAELPAPLREEKRKLGQRMACLVEHWVEMIEEDPDRLKKMGALEIGIITDKALLLQGEATSITERRDAGTGNKFLSLMVSAGGEKSAKGAVIEQAAGALADPGTHPAGVASDGQPLAKPAQLVDSERSRSVACGVDSEAASFQEGGGGASGASDEPTHNT